MLIELLLQDMKEAMKQKDMVKKNTITMLRSAIKQIEVDERRQLTDDEICSIIQKQIRTKQKAIDEFERGHREDLVEEARSEISTLEAYLPKQMGEGEILAVVDEVLGTGETNMGVIMKSLKEKLGGKVDMGRVNALVRARLP